MNFLPVLTQFHYFFLAKFFNYISCVSHVFYENTFGLQSLENLRKLLSTYRDALLLLLRLNMTQRNSVEEATFLHSHGMPISSWSWHSFFLNVSCGWCFFKRKLYAVSDMWKGKQNGRAISPAPFFYFSTIILLSSFLYTFVRSPMKKRQFDFQGKSSPALSSCFPWDLFKALLLLSQTCVLSPPLSWDTVKTAADNFFSFFSPSNKSGHFGRACSRSPRKQGRSSFWRVQAGSHLWHNGRLEITIINPNKFFNVVVFLLGWPASSALWYQDGQLIDDTYEEIIPGKSRNTMKLSPLKRNHRLTEFTCVGANNNRSQALTKSVILDLYCKFSYLSKYYHT